MSANGLGANKVMGFSVTDYSDETPPPRFKPNQVAIVLLIDYAPYIKPGPEIVLAILTLPPFFFLRRTWTAPTGESLPVLEGGQSSPTGVPAPPALLIPPVLQEDGRDAPMNLPPNNVNNAPKTIVYPAPLYRWLVLPP